MSQISMVKHVTSEVAVNKLNGQFWTVDRDDTPYWCWVRGYQLLTRIKEFCTIPESCHDDCNE